MNTFKTYRQHDQMDCGEKAVNEAGVPEFWSFHENLIVDDVGRNWLKLLNRGRDLQTRQIINSQGKS